MHFSSNVTPSSNVKFSCHSARSNGCAMWFPNPVAIWFSSKFTPIIVTCKTIKNTIDPCPQNARTFSPLLFRGLKTEKKTTYQPMPYHAKKFLSFFHTTENKCIPKWVKLVTPIIHNSGQIAVNLFGPQRVSVIPHIVIQAADIKQYKPTIKTT